MQGDTLFTIGKGESVESLKGEPFFWIDVNGFSETDLSHLATVPILCVYHIFYLHLEFRGAPADD